MRSVSGLWDRLENPRERSRLVCRDEDGVGAFVYLKLEDESIDLENGQIPAAPRLKIGTLKVADRIQGERLGEGAIGLALWRWRDLRLNEVYVTVFEKHKSLVGMLERFGFVEVGFKANGEAVYMKDRRDLSYNDAYSSFPFLNPAFSEGNLLVINDGFHDELFPYSELRHEFQESFRTAAANGVTKIYIGTPSSDIAIAPGHAVLIYRKYTGDAGRPGFKSVVTSYCMVTDVVRVKSRGRALLTLDEYKAWVKNKSVFTEAELESRYNDNNNLVVIEMVYLGYFGSGHNVNWVWLKQNGYWQDKYPLMFAYDKAAFLRILKEGAVNIEDAVVD